MGTRACACRLQRTWIRPHHPNGSARARAETYLRVLQRALGVDGAWLALVHGHKGVRLYAAVGSLCAAGEVHAWQNSLSLWTCSPATHRVLAIDDTTLDARRAPCGTKQAQRLTDCATLAAVVSVFVH